MNNQSSQKNNSYLQASLAKVPFLLSLQDRKPLSVTYGCFDRNYWGWKFIDFPGPRFQEGVCALAFFYSVDFSGNYLFKNKRIFEWLLAGMDYWAKLAHKNGCFDEAYPYEQSFAATVFTVFYVGEAFLAVSGEIPEPLKGKLTETFSRAGEWLCRNDERHGILSNHLAAAASALHNAYLITGNKRFQERCDYFLQKIYRHQSQEGWFEEYGGADPGYQTLCLFFLARLWQRTKDDVLLEKIRSAIEFLSYLLHPDASIGGEYASRNTEFYFPAAFEMFAEKLTLARKIAQFMRKGIEVQMSAGLSAMDSYNFFPMLNNYIFAGLNVLAQESSEELPFQRKFQRYYKEAGIYIKSSDKYYAIVGVSKGGVIKVFDKEKGSLSYSDCGYWMKLKNEDIFSSQSLDRSRVACFEGDKITLSSRFSPAARKIFHPGLFILFRVFTLSLGRIPFFSYRIKSALVKALVLKKKNIGCVLSRSIEFKDNQIDIMDSIENADIKEPAFLARGDRFTTIHMGSSQYFQRGELEPEYFKSENLLESTPCKKLIKFEKTINF